jgi:TPR repeat protein
MPGLGPGIHDLWRSRKVVDGRAKPGRDGLWLVGAAVALLLGGHAAAADLSTGTQLYDAGRWADAIAALAPHAQAGDTEAQFLTGAMLLDGGNGISRDRERGLALLTAAGERGHGGAIFELYLANTGTPAGRQWAERLAAQGRKLDGHRRAQAALCAEAIGQDYLRGFHGPRDPAAARAWLGYAVELGRSDAQPALLALDAELTADERARAATLGAMLGR